MLRSLRILLTQQIIEAEHHHCSINLSCRNGPKEIVLISINWKKKILRLELFQSILLFALIATECHSEINACWRMSNILHHTEQVVSSLQSECTFSQFCNVVKRIPFHFINSCSLEQFMYSVEELINSWLGTFVLLDFVFRLRQIFFGVACN